MIFVARSVDADQTKYSDILIFKHGSFFLNLTHVRVKSGKFGQWLNSDSDLVSFIFELLE